MAAIRQFLKDAPLRHTARHHITGSASERAVRVGLQESVLVVSNVSSSTCPLAYKQPLVGRMILAGRSLSPPFGPRALPSSEGSGAPEATSRSVLCPASRRTVCPLSVPHGPVEKERLAGPLFTSTPSHCCAWITNPQQHSFCAVFWLLHM